MDSQTTVDHSISDLRAMLSGKADATETKETPAAAGTPEARTSEPASEPAQNGQESKQQADRGADGKFRAKEAEESADEPVSPNVQKRIDKAVKAQRDAERRIAELQAQVTGSTQGSRPATENAQPSTEAGKRPKQEDFEDYDKYVEALTDWKADERDRAKEETRRKAEYEAQREKVLKGHGARIEEAAKAADWEDVVTRASSLPCSEAAHHAIQESEYGPGVVRYLVEHPDDARDFAALSATRQVAMIGRIEERLQKPATAAPAPPAKELPRPPRNVGGASSAKAPDLNDPDIDMREFKRLARGALSS